MEMSLINMQTQMMLSVHPAFLNRSLVSKYNQAQRKATITRWLTRLFGRSNAILALSSLTAAHPVVTSHYAGLQSVSVDQIHGSEARCTDFDRNFNPLSATNKSRWLSVARARMTGVPLPPVNLIKIGTEYFVRDGHHRISVAHSLGERFIEAEVTVWDVAR